ncbi:MAG: hypothetical protein ACI4F2_06410 [Acutalibacteraceae bacterium]
MKTVISMRWTTVKTLSAHSFAKSYKRAVIITAACTATAITGFVVSALILSIPATPNARNADYVMNYEERNETEMQKKRTFVIVILTAIIIILSLALTGCESCSRSLKSAQSDLNGGIDRVITVYDNTGNVLKTYEGKTDIEDGEYSGKVLFDLNGKRIIIYNAIVIAEEK